MWVVGKLSVLHDYPQKLFSLFFPDRSDGVQSTSSSSESLSSRSSRELTQPPSNSLSSSPQTSKRLPHIVTPPMLGANGPHRDIRMQQTNHYAYNSSTSRRFCSHLSLHLPFISSSEKLYASLHFLLFITSTSHIDSNQIVNWHFFPSNFIFQLLAQEVSQVKLNFFPYVLPWRTVPTIPVSFPILRHSYKHFRT